MKKEWLLIFLLCLGLPSLAQAKENKQVVSMDAGPVLLVPFAFFLMGGIDFGYEHQVFPHVSAEARVKVGYFMDWPFLRFELKSRYYFFKENLKGPYLSAGIGIFDELDVYYFAETGAKFYLNAQKQTWNVEPWVGLTSTDPYQSDFSIFQDAYINFGLRFGYAF